MRLLGLAAFGSKAMNEIPFTPPHTRSVRYEKTELTTAQKLRAIPRGFGIGFVVSTCTAFVLWLYAELSTSVYVGELQVGGMCLLWGLLALYSVRERYYWGIAGAATGCTWGYFGTFIVLAFLRLVIDGMNWSGMLFRRDWNLELRLSIIIPILGTISVLPFWFVGQWYRRKRAESQDLDNAGN